jgi:hypothetical protein
MVPAQDGDTITIAQLEGHKESDRLNGVVATVDIVAHEEVVGVRRVSTDAEQF